MTEPFEAILALIHERQFDRAKSAIEVAHETLPASHIHRLTALLAVLEIRSGNFSRGVALIRQAIEQEPTWLSHWHRLSMYLMDEQLWLEAIEAVSELISLSEQSGDEYFLNDARFRKAVCLKALGRHAEIPSQKRNIVPDTEVLIGDKFYTLEDLD